MDQIPAILNGLYPFVPYRFRIQEREGVIVLGLNKMVLQQVLQRVIGCVIPNNKRMICILCFCICGDQIRFQLLIHSVNFLIRCPDVFVLSDISLLDKLHGCHCAFLVRFGWWKPVIPDANASHHINRETNAGRLVAADDPALLVCAVLRFICGPCFTMTVAI